MPAPLRVALKLIRQRLQRGGGRALDGESGTLSSGPHLPSRNFGVFILVAETPRTTYKAGGGEPPCWRCSAEDAWSPQIPVGPGAAEALRGVATEDVPRYWLLSVWALLAPELAALLHWAFTFFRNIFSYFGTPEDSELLFLQFSKSI